MNIRFLAIIFQYDGNTVVVEPIWNVIRNATGDSIYTQELKYLIGLDRQEQSLNSILDENSYFIHNYSQYYRAADEMSKLNNWFLSFSTALLSLFLVSFLGKQLRVTKRLLPSFVEFDIIHTRNISEKWKCCHFNKLF